MTHSLRGGDLEKLGWPKTIEELEGRLGGGKYTPVVGSAANVGEVLHFESDKSQELPLMISFNVGKAVHTVRIETVEDRVTVLVPLEGKPVTHLEHQYKEIHWFSDDAEKHVTRVNPQATLATCVLTYEAAGKGKSHGIRVDSVSLKFDGEVGKEEAFWTDIKRGDRPGGYGVPIIKESLDGIISSKECSWNGEDQIRLRIVGEGLFFPDPMEKNGLGEAMLTRKTISVTGAEGGGAWDMMVGVAALDEQTIRTSDGFSGECTLNVGCVFNEGYEGPLFAQVTGPGPASSKVQVGILLTEKDYHPYVVKRDREKLIMALTAQFDMVAEDGFFTLPPGGPAGLESFLGGPEGLAEKKAKYAELKDNFVSGDENLLSQVMKEHFVWVAVLQLEGDDRASLADLLKACELL